MFQYRQALVRIRQGDTDRDIARSRLMGRRKAAVFRALASAQGWLDANTALPTDAQIAASLAPARASPATVSTLVPYREAIERWLADGVSGVVIHGALQREHGYSGSYSSVYRFLRALGRSRLPEATVRLDFAPAEAAQVDFGAGPLLLDPASGRARRTWCFVMTLCFSRHQYVEFVFDQSVPTWLGCHRRAFEWFTAVPARVIIDNPKCAITRACSRDPVVQRAYAECAEGYGFKIDPCPPADPQKKGMVESGVKYVKRNFLPTRTFRDLPDLNAQARQWVLQLAGYRDDGTTHEAPLARFEREWPLMRPLPAIAPDLGVWSLVGVHRDGHVQFQHSLNSVPFRFIGQRLWLRATDTSVAIHADHQLIAQHLRAQHRGTRRTVRQHLPPDAQACFLRDRHWCASQAEQIGPACVQLIRTLLADRIVERLRAAQGVIRLATQFDAVRLEAACRRALDHGSPYFRTVKTLLAHHPELLSASNCAASTNPYLQQARFARPARSLFVQPPEGESP
ncbi:MAG: IS21 family transposase [Proteobacteria bacterium]|nr:IS21 family transposase [Pseudomonadota bacterium]